MSIKKVIDGVVVTQWEASPFIARFSEVFAPSFSMGGFSTTESRQAFLDRFLAFCRGEAMKHPPGSEVRRLWIEAGETTKREYAERAAAREKLGQDSCGRPRREKKQ